MHESYVLRNDQYPGEEISPEVYILSDKTECSKKKQIERKANTFAYCFWDVDEYPNSTKDLCQIIENSKSLKDFQNQFQERFQHFPFMLSEKEFKNLPPSGQVYYLSIKKKINALLETK